MSTQSALVTVTKPRTKATKRRPGKPSKRTPARLAKLKELLESGMSLRGATRACGMCESLIYKWREADPLIDQMVTQAMAESERKLVELAMEGARKDGRIALMMLERRFPDSWGKRTEHVHAHADAGSLAQLVELRRARDARLSAVTVEVLKSGEVEL
jgi:hypothetical protein